MLANRIKGIPWILTDLSQYEVNLVGKVSNVDLKAFSTCEFWMTSNNLKVVEITVS